MLIKKSWKILFFEVYSCCHFNHKAKFTSMTAEKPCRKINNRSSLLIAWPHFWGRVAFPSISVVLSGQKMIRLAPQEDEVTPDGVAGTGGVSQSSFSPLWMVGREGRDPQVGITSLSIMPSALFTPHKTTSTKNLLPSRNGAKMELN